MKIGTLLALPVRLGDVVTAVLVVDRVEIQSFTGTEPEILGDFADLAGEAIARARASQSLEDHGAEFAAIYPESRKLAAQTDAASVRRHLLRCARELVSFEAAAVVVADERQTRYVVETAEGWAHEYEGREVGLSEKTWSAWVVRSAESPIPLDHLAGEKDRMPILVLDEGSGRAESLLAVPLRARNQSLGALILTGRRGSFSAAAGRVLELVCNQAAAALSTIQLLDRTKDMAVRDGLTGLYNRRSSTGCCGRPSGARTARRGASRCSSRPRPLQEAQRHLRPPGGRRGPPLRGRRPEAQRCGKGTRPPATAARSSSAFLPGADEAGAEQLGERVRKAIEDERLTVDDARIRLSASLGVAVWPADGREPDGLVAAADRALYAAKDAGRNRIVVASRMPPAGA